MTPFRELFRTHRQTFAHLTAGSPKSPAKTRLVATMALTSVMTCSVLTLDGCKGNFNIGPSNGEIAGVIIGAAVVIGGTTAILIHVNHSHHQVKGCASSGPHGLQLQTADKKTWLLTGNTPDIQAGDLIKLHGTKLRSHKHSTADPTFQVEKLTKDYGPCKITPPAAAGLAPVESTPPAE